MQQLTIRKRVIGREREQQRLLVQQYIPHHHRHNVTVALQDCCSHSATMDTTISPTAAAPPDVAASLCPSKAQQHYKQLLTQWQRWWNRELNGGRLNGTKDGDDGEEYNRRDGSD